MLSLTIIAFLHLLFSGSVAAESGDDFSNNLFTDLGPLLALFGERVTMQFLSQAMGWADCIILATAPLGIITIIVAAIRVGGPPWLKALIGRATENIATAELELMSSTSKEVCELWNGKDVVRCAGSAPIWEFICLLPSGEMPENPVVKVMKIEDAVKASYMIKPLDGENSLWSKIRHQFQLLGTNHENNEEKGDKLQLSTNEVIIVRNTQHPAPNISHNRSKNIGRGELYLAACFGIILQIGVLLYCGFITHYSKITSRFQKDGQPVSSYAFPLTIVGTVFLNIGMLICSHVVESSTTEEIFAPAEGRRARLVWLQQEKTVGDQEFKSFALFTKEDQPMIITSRRVGQHDQKKDQKVKKAENDEARTTAQGAPTVLEIKTVLGTIISLIGFFAQFIGIRGMHWSVSVASLIAVLIMTAVRAWVRRGLTTPLLSESLLPEFELDWFADTFKDLKNAKWYKFSDSIAEDKAGSSQEKAGVSANESNSNESNSNESNSKESNSNESYCNKSNSDESYSNKSNSDESISDEMIPRSRAENSDFIDARKFDVIRQRLAALASWRGPVSQEAVAVARAIEATMNILHGDLQDEYNNSSNCSWGYRVRVGESEEQTLGFNLTRQGGKWKANAGEIEAALSLRLFYVKDNHQKTPSTVEVFNKLGGPLDDAWLRGKGDMPKLGIRVLGPRAMPLLRNLQWWLPTDGPRVLRVKNLGKIASEASQAGESGNRQPDATESIDAGSSGPEIVQIEASRVIQNESNRVSYRLQLSPPYFRVSQKTKWKFEISREESENSDYVEVDNVLLAIDSQDSLEILYAKDIICVFMWAIAKALEHPIGGKTDMQTKSVGSWKSFTIHNDKMSTLVQAIQGTGLCSIHDAYISIIPPFSIQQRLPEVRGIVELVRSHAKEFERLHNWRAASEVYLWLSDRKDAFGVESNTYARAVAVLLAFLKTLQDMIEQREAEQIDFDMDTEIPEGLAERFNDTLKTVSAELRDSLESLCGFQDENGRQKQAERTSGDFYFKYQKLIFISADIYRKLYHSSYLWREECTGEKAKAEDIFYRSPLHYFAAFVYDADRHVDEQNERDEEIALKGHKFPEDETESRRFQSKMQGLIEAGANLDGCDIRGWTPLHYACRAGNTSMARLLLQRGASVNLQDRSGTAPVHCAATGGHVKMVQVLLEFGAAIDMADGSGSTALHLAAFKGFTETVELLCQRGCRKTRDRWGRSALHLAAISGQTAVIDVDQLADDASSKDYQDRTPLHLASKCGHNSFVQRLLEIPRVDKTALDTKKRTPLHIDAEAGQQTDVPSFISSHLLSTHLDARDQYGETPLHLACGEGHDDVAETLLDAGAAIDAKGRWEATSLHRAVEEQKESTVRLLTARKASVEMGDRHGRTALHFAARTGNATIFQHLLERGADVNTGAQTMEMVMGTPLHWASLERDNNPIVPLILDSGMARVEQTDEDGRTALHSAALHHRQKHAELLVKQGANMDARDDEGCTPLHVAINNSEYARQQRIDPIDFVSVLIRRGADVNAANSYGSTLLHIAVASERTAEVTRQLLEAGAEVDTADKNGDTPLHEAARANYLEGVDALIKRGANVQAVNSDGKTPQMLADEEEPHWWAENISR